LNIFYYQTFKLITQKKEKTKEHHSYATFEKKWHQQDNKGDCFWWVHEATVARSGSRWLIIFSEDCFLDLHSRWLVVNVILCLHCCSWWICSSEVALVVWVVRWSSDEHLTRWLWFVARPSDRHCSCRVCSWLCKEMAVGNEVVREEAIVEEAARKRGSRVF